uniref:C2H2-type domain-containing protein n=1 Tax=Trichogramma kaykai TaxID=54128 RepID=A0ABD2WKJ3_9HYME
MNIKLSFAIMILNSKLLLNAGERSLDNQKMLSYLHICRRELYHSAQGFVATNRATNDSLSTTESLELIRFFSSNYIAMSVIEIGRIDEVVRHNRLSDSTRPLNLVLLIESAAGIESYARVTRRCDMRGHNVLLFFRRRSDYCREPRADNRLNLEFDSLVLAWCHEAPVLQEWYSIFAGRTKVKDFIGWDPASRTLRLLNDFQIYRRRNSLDGKILRVSEIQNHHLLGGFVRDVAGPVRPDAERQEKLQAGPLRQLLRRLGHLHAEKPKRYIYGRRAIFNDYRRVNSIIFRSEKLPNSSTRIVYWSLSFCCFIHISVYMALLCSYITVFDVEKPINSLTELTAQRSYKIVYLKNSGYLNLLHTRTFKRSQETHETQSNHEIEIEIECVDVKSIVNLSVPKRLDNWTKNHLLDIQEGSDFEAKDKIKLEPEGAVKEEFSYDDIDKDISNDCEINGQNIKIDPQELAKISEKSIECDKCLKKFPNKRSLKFHMNSVHSNNLYPSQVCEKTFGQNDILNVHTDSVHHKIKHACDICQKTFSGKHNLKKHIDSVHNGVSHECDICGNVYTQRVGLKRHMDSEHNKITHACEICGNVLKRRTYLIRHIDAIHRKISYPCDICEKTYSDKSALKIHMNAVHNGVTYSCDICGKAFALKIRLKKHVEMIHHKIKHACEICQKTFSDKSNLKKHIDSMHNGVRHECDICGKIFKLKDNLKKHINSVHKSISYACDKCEKTYTQISSLNVHINEIHARRVIFVPFFHNKKKRRRKKNRMFTCLASAILCPPPPGRVFFDSIRVKSISLFLSRSLPSLFIFSLSLILVPQRACCIRFEWMIEILARLDEKEEDIGLSILRA